MNPTDFEAYNNKGTALNKLKRYQEAIEFYNKSIELNPTYSAVYNGKGIALSNLERYQEAIEYYSKAIELVH